MIIDFHTHCFANEIAERAIRKLSSAVRFEASYDGTVRGLCAAMKRNKIDISILQNIATKPTQTTIINDWAIANSNGENLICFGTIHPDFVAFKSEIRRIKKAGLKGIKVHSDYQSTFVDDPKMLKIFEACMEEDMIIMLHGGLDLGIHELVRCTPDRLARLLSILPYSKFVAAHMGGYRYWDITEVYLLGKDIFFDTSFVSHMPAEQVKRFFENHDSERFLFATDSPWSNVAEEIQSIQNSDLSESAKQGIFAGNAKRLLGMTK